MSRRDRPESATPNPEPPPAPPADVMTPDPPERNPPAADLGQADRERSDVKAGVATLSTRDAEILHAALSRVARLHGYSDEHMPEHAGDIDATGADPRIAGLVAWAKGARLP